MRMLELAYGLELVLGEMRIVQLLVPDRPTAATSMISCPNAPVQCPRGIGHDSSMGTNEVVWSGVGWRWSGGGGVKGGVGWGGVE